MPYRDNKYLDWLRGQPCEICGQEGEPHHVRRLYWDAGMAIKPHDYVCISLCRKHHDPIVEQMIPVDFVIIENLMRYIQEMKNAK